MKTQEKLRLPIPKKLMKGNTTSHFIIIEKGIVQGMGLEAGDFVYVTLEKVKDEYTKRKQLVKLANELAEDGYEAEHIVMKKVKNKEVIGEDEKERKEKQ